MALLRSYKNRRKDGESKGGGAHKIKNLRGVIMILFFQRGDLYHEAVKPRKPVKLRNPRKPRKPLGGFLSSLALASAKTPDLRGLT